MLEHVLVTPLPGLREDQLLVLEGAQTCVESLLDTQHAADQLRRELAPDDGGHLEDRPRRRVQPLQPGEQEVLESVGERALLPSRSQTESDLGLEQTAALEQVPSDLFGEQRVALGLFHQQAGQLRSEDVGAQARLHQLERGLLGEPAQAKLADAAAARPRRTVGGPVRAQDQELQSCLALDDPRQELL